MHVYSFLLLLCFSFGSLNSPLAFFLLNTPAKWTRQIEPPHWTHQTDPPLRTRQIDLPLRTRQIDPPLRTRHFGPTRLTRHFEPANAPLTRNSPAGQDPTTAPPPSPPSPTSMRRIGEGGGGQARGPPEHPKQVLYFTAPTCKWPTYARAPYIHNVSILNTEWRNHFEEDS
jgi:hypothetical protein